MKRSSWYLVSYIAVLIIFSFFYNTLDGQFYHSSIQREPAYLEQQNIFKTSLSFYLDNEFRNDEFSQFLINDSLGIVLPLQIKRIAIDRIKQIDDGELLVTASLMLNSRTEKTEQARTDFTYIANVAFNIRNWRILENDNWMIENIQVKRVVANPNTFYKDRIEGLRYPLESDPGMKRIRFTDNISMEMTRYASATFGQPKSTADNLGRMFYLSAITITTTGYGDIVPLSNLARFAVAFEAFLGITIIGFFLNSVMQDFAAGKKYRG